MAEPARKIVDRYTVHQQVPSVAVAEGVSADLAARRYSAELPGSFERLLHLAPRLRAVRVYDASL